MGSVRFFEAPNIIQSASSLMALRDQIEGRNERRQRQEKEMTTQRLAGMVLSGGENGKFALQELQRVNPGAALELDQGMKQLEAQRIAVEHAGRLNPLLREEASNRIIGQEQEQELKGIEIQKAQEAQQEAARVKSLEVAKNGARFAEEAYKDPAKWKENRARGIALGLLPPDSPEEFPSPDEMKAFGDNLRFIERVANDPLEWKAADDFGKGVEQALRLKAINEKTAQEMLRTYQQNKLAQQGADISETRARAGKLRSESGGGGSGLPGGAATEVAKDYAKTEVISDQIRQLEAFIPEIEGLVGLQGKAAKKVGKFKDWLGIMDVPEEGKDSQFTKANRLEQTTTAVTDAIRVMVTGAAAPEAELKRITDKLNTDMGKAEFVGAIRDLKKLYESSQAVRGRLLAEGIPENSQEFKNRLSGGWLERRKIGDLSGRPVLTRSQFDELTKDLAENKKLTPEQIRRHVEENYRLTGEQ